MSAQQAFDDYAKTYDRDFSDTQIGRAQRELIWQRVAKQLNTHQVVLELNCGTGIDAFLLAEHCKSVLATDISEGMITVCQQKQEIKKAHNLTFQSLAISDIDELAPQQYDVVFSNFAGLNCLAPEELKDFAQKASRRLTANGRLAIVLLGKKCWMERLYFILKRDVRKNRRLKGEGTDVKLLSQTVRTYYYTRREVLANFSDYVEIASRPIGLIVPPAFMESIVKNRPRLLKWLMRAEQMIACRFSSDYGDHFLLILQKKH